MQTLGPRFGPTTTKLDLVLPDIWIHISLLMIHYEHQKLLWEVIR